MGTCELGPRFGSAARFWSDSPNIMCCAWCAGIMVGDVCMTPSWPQVSHIALRSHEMPQGSQQQLFHRPTGVCPSRHAACQGGHNQNRCAQVCQALATTNADSPGRYFLAHYISYMRKKSSLCCCVHRLGHDCVQQQGQGSAAAACWGFPLLPLKPPVPQLTSIQGGAGQSQRLV